MPDDTSAQLDVLHFFNMSNTITVRLSGEMAEWLESTAKKTGVPKGKIIRDQLKRAMDSEEKGYMRLAGSVRGSKNLSQRKGFSTS